MRSTARKRSAFAAHFIDIWPEDIFVITAACYSVKRGMGSRDGVKSALDSSLEELSYHCEPPGRSRLAFPIRPCFS